MKQTTKQLLAQKVLSQHKTITLGKITLMYTPATSSAENAGKRPVIIVSVPKKVVPKATARNYIKRVLRAILQQNLPATVLRVNVWMWICKEPRISKDSRLQLIALVRALSS